MLFRKLIVLELSGGHLLAFVARSSDKVRTRHFAQLSAGRDARETEYHSITLNVIFVGWSSYGNVYIEIRMIDRECHKNTCNNSVNLAGSCPHNTRLAFTPHPCKLEQDALLRT